MNNNIKQEYFDWLYTMVCGNRYSEEISFKKLLTTLHDTEFTYSIQMDSNRAENGKALRRRFSLEREDTTISEQLEGPCSILEMMVALALRCEETIMLDPEVGDRTGQWFWSMIASLGLGSMIDTKYDEQFVKNVLSKFLNRKYEANGKGGLFTVKNCDQDLRNYEIWFQMCRYLDQFVYLTENK